MNGILLFYKEQDWTSRDACNKLQGIFHTKSIGHTGTLDPFAEGLLIVTINNANKITQFVDDQKKTYVATLKLGKETSTGDLTGEFINEVSIPSLNEEVIITALNKFKGKIKQIPPMTSAIHVDGRKLYEMYYNGETIERSAREVEVFDIKLISFTNDEIVFESTVSKGTYLRVLGEDIAKELNTLGYLTKLVRTKIDDFDIKDAIKMSEVKEDTPLMNISTFLTHIEHIKADDILAKKVKDGMTIKLPNANGDRVLIIDKDDNALAIYDKRPNGYYSCKRGLWS